MGGDEIHKKGNDLSRSGVEWSGVKWRWVWWKAWGGDDKGGAKTLILAKK